MHAKRRLAGHSPLHGVSNFGDLEFKAIRQVDTCAMFFSGYRVPYSVNDALCQCPDLVFPFARLTVRFKLDRSKNHRQSIRTNRSEDLKESAARSAADN